MAVLVIGAKEKQQIQSLIDTAQANIVPYATMLIMVSCKATKPLPIMAEQLTILLPMGIRVSYSIEEHMPGVNLRHISISVDRPTHIPSPILIDEVLKEFGFVNRLEGCERWPEDIGGGHTAINVVEPVSGSWNTSDNTVG